MRHANSHLGTDPVSSVSKNYTYWSQREDTGYEYWSSLNPPRKNDKISFVVCPSWGIIFPPYNAARISSLLRENGYEVTVYDTNIESYHYLKDKLDYDPWDAIYWDHWIVPNYKTKCRFSIYKMSAFMSKMSVFTPKMSAFFLKCRLFFLYVFCKMNKDTIYI